MWLLKTSIYKYDAIDDDSMMDLESDMFFKSKITSERILIKSDFDFIRLDSVSRVCMHTKSDDENNGFLTFHINVVIDVTVYEVFATKVKFIADNVMLVLTSLLYADKSTNKLIDFDKDIMKPLRNELDFIEAKKKLMGVGQKRGMSVEDMKENDKLVNQLRTSSIKKVEKSLASALGLDLSLVESLCLFDKTSSNISE